MKVDKMDKTESTHGEMISANKIIVRQENI
jgi:hypothetical protein